GRAGEQSGTRSRSAQCAGRSVSACPDRNLLSAAETAMIQPSPSPADSPAATHLTPATDAPPPAETTSRGEPAIEIRRLDRHFGKLKAVNNVSFCALPGPVMGFIGPTGAGKTTTMRILATLDTPTRGDAFVGGHSVINYPDRVRRVL